MAELVAARSLVIRAPPRILHAILADYRVAHPAILPKRAFLSLAVEKGGTGSGTTFLLTMKAFGAVRTMRADVTEPNPGRTIVETDVETGLRTTFELAPLEGDAGTRVTITTRWSARGLRGVFERVFAPAFLERLYAEKLLNLARVAEEQARAATRSPA